jgi:hypothetical protein
VRGFQLDKWFYTSRICGFANRLCRRDGLAPRVFAVVEGCSSEYAEAEAYLLHREVAGARPIDLGVFDNELEIANWLCG